MYIKTQITEKDFINVSFVMVYSRIATRILTALFIVLLLAGLLFAVLVPTFSFSDMSYLLIVLLIRPVQTYFSAKTNFKANKRIGENIEYQLDKENLVIKGESFRSQLSWDKIYKVTQTKNWVLIWQSKQLANPIPKRDIWEGEISDLKEILQIHNVKNNL